MNPSPAPTHLQVNGKTIHFMANTGVVDKVSKRVETRLSASASGGGTQQYGRTFVSTPASVSVSSSNTTVTELWMNDGNKELDHTLRTDLSVRENQKVSIVMVESELGQSRQYVGVINYNTGTWQTLSSTDDIMQSLVMPSMGAFTYFLLCAGAVLLYAVHWTVVLLALGGIFYMYQERNNRLSACKNAVNQHVIDVRRWLTNTHGV